MFRNITLAILDAIGLRGIARNVRDRVFGVSTTTGELVGLGLTDPVWTMSPEMKERQALAQSAKTLEDLREKAHSLNFTYFTDYDAQIATKRREFSSAIAHFGIHIDGKTVLDIGPGTADSLDVAKDMGASVTSFVEEEPFFVRFAELKGHSGITTNYTFKPFFDESMKGKFDLVYTKGSINCEWVNQQNKMLLDGDPSHFFKFDIWLDELISLLKPETGQIILMPAMDRQDERIIDEEYDLDTYYWCPDVEKYRNSYFSQTLVKKNFKIVEGIPNFNQPKAFPQAFYYHQ